MSSTAEELPTGNARLMITLAVMSATLIQVLDTTIVNVALPHMGIGARVVGDARPAEDHRVRGAGDEESCKEGEESFHGP